MGEARRRSFEGLPPRNTKTKKTSKNDSPRIVPWLSVTENQRTQFIDFTIKAGWVGIAILILIWLTVRIVGPAAGWWIPADL
ncbi:DUF2839 domain-containing protein [Prochlorococcus marinus]|uniref:DUF2839 domain-containing protein n=1 Tax=Prochlorococcus marinus TaxID=1219 RepID=UPI0022B4565B|nr:DUF2839 domain-containing protein [Prochlorococcus marinus]